MAEPQQDSAANKWLLVMVPVLVLGELGLIALPRENYPAVPPFAGAGGILGLVLCVWALSIILSQKYWTDLAQAFGVIGICLIILAASAFALPFIGVEASLPAHEALQGPEPVADEPAPSGLTYVSLSSIDPRFAANLMQSLHDQGFRMTDQPSRSAITLQVSATVSIKSYHLIGSTETWKATSDASLKVIDSRDQRQLFSSMATGQGAALDSDEASGSAVATAFDQLINQYQATKTRQ